MKSAIEFGLLVVALAALALLTPVILIALLIALVATLVVLIPGCLFLALVYTCDSAARRLTTWSASLTEDDIAYHLRAVGRLAARKLQCCYRHTVSVSAPIARRVAVEALGWLVAATLAVVAAGLALALAYLLWCVPAIAIALVVLAGTLTLALCADEVVRAAETVSDSAPAVLYFDLPLMPTPRGNARFGLFALSAEDREELLRQIRSERKVAA